MGQSQKERKSKISPARFFVPLVTMGILFAVWRYNLRWATVPIVLFLIVFYLFLPKIVRRKIDGFNKQAILLLTTGKANEVPRLVRRSIFLQLFGPSGPMDGKLGLAYVQCGAYDTAVSCFENAIPSASPPERPALQTGLVKALFVTGDLARAEAEGKAVLQITRLPELLAIVARARVGLGKIDDETRKLLDEASTLSPSPDVSMMIELTRIEAALQSGRKYDALPSDADSKQRYIRAWIQFVRGLIREKKGDVEKAQRSFFKAYDLMPDSFVGIVAEKQMDKSIGKKTKNRRDEADSDGKDPAVRRKRKKRR